MRTSSKNAWLMVLLPTCTVILLLLVWAVCTLPSVLRSKRQLSTLLNHADPDEVAHACASLALLLPGEEAPLVVTDPRVPAVIRSLKPASIHGSSNVLTLEFKNGERRYGYKAAQEGGNPSLWMLWYYGEKDTKMLARITHE